MQMNKARKFLKFIREQEGLKVAQNDDGDWEIQDADGKKVKGPFDTKDAADSALEDMMDSDDDDDDSEE